MEIHVVWGQMVSEVMVPDASPGSCSAKFPGRESFDI